MEFGTVTKLEKGHGYGFIQTEDKKEVFFHQRWLRYIKFRDINIGSKVVFDLQKGHRGLKALNMRFAPDDENFLKNFTPRNRK
ncbi:MAG TPA: cold shock domain-containing protein [candidate division Zixibacteria bacterium]|nr:cold shock domain-containing protein [candidate division Zixibacteria bacterium]HEQ99171.1 cold shock domain-containing protein [candidate division Zixibacteria bacterium]